MLCVRTKTSFFTEQSYWKPVLVSCAGVFVLCMVGCNSDGETQLSQEKIEFSINDDVDQISYTSEYNSTVLEKWPFYPLDPSHSDSIVNPDLLLTETTRENALNP